MLGIDPRVCSRIALVRHSGSKGQVRQSGLKCHLTLSRGRARILGNRWKRKAFKESDMRRRLIVLICPREGGEFRKPSGGGSHTAADPKVRNGSGSIRDRHVV